MQRMVARACEEFGTIHILVNNAARFVFNFVTDITEEGDCIPVRQSATFHTFNKVPASWVQLSLVPNS